MKRTTLSFLTVSFAVFAGAADFDRGGVTFPMEQISAARFESSGENKEQNLLKNSDLSAPLVDWRKSDSGWYSVIWIGGPGNMKKYYEQTKNLVSAKIVDADGEKALELRRPKELEKQMGKDSALFTMTFQQTVRLPDKNGGLYCLSFKSRNQTVGEHAHAQMVLIDFYDGSDPRPAKGKKICTGHNSRIASGAQWHLYRYEFNVPAGTRDLTLAIRVDNCGIFQAKNLKLVKLKAADPPFSVELAPGKLLDNTFALASGDPGILAFKFRSNLPEKSAVPDSVTLNLELPREISVAGTNSFFGKEIRSTDKIINGKTWRRWEIELSPYVLNRVRKIQGFDGWNVNCLMISGKAPAGTEWNNCRYYLTGKDKIISGIENFSLKMLAPFPKVSAPKLFYSGFSSITQDISFQQPEAENRFAEFTGRTGNTLVTAYIRPDYSEKMRQNGVRIVTAESYAIANGFRIGTMDGKKKPDYSKFLDKDGKCFEFGGIASTCPMAVYNRTPYYREVVLPLLEANLKGFDGLQPNWEPFMFVGRGCFCDNCRAEFAKFAKLPQDEIKKLWPSQLQPGGEYRDLAVRFRAYQHGRLIKTLQDDTLALGGTKIGFCPEVGWDQMIFYPDYDREQGEFTPYEYAGSLKWLNVWGPYNWFLADQPYHYKKGAYLRTWVVAERVMRDYHKKFTNPAKRAKLMAMPHGSQCDMTALGQPEGMAMDQLSSFLAGYDASILYFFPRGYDHRFWKALADSNALIAANEEMVMGGKRRNDVTASPETPFPGPVEAIEPRILPDVKKSDLLQIAAFEKNGKILVAAGNFWEKGDVVFKLRVPGLSADRKYSVQEKAFQRAFLQETDHAFTGKELADGILLHAGALRWAFFEISSSAPSMKHNITAADMRKMQELCRKENQAAAEAEHKRDQMLRAENDIGEIKKMSSGTLSCEPVDQNGKPMIRIRSGNNSMLLDPRGMALQSWNVDKTELVEPGFGLSAFWTPGKYGMVLNCNYRILNQEITPSGLSICAEAATSVRNYPQLSGLTIRKTIRISSSLKRIAFDVKLTNTQETAMSDVGYRWSFIPAAWSNRSKGCVVSAGETFSRPNANSLWIRNCNPAEEQILRGLFMIRTPVRKISQNQFDFILPGKITVGGVFLPKDQFAGVAIWDTADMISATFEPFYRSKMIVPNGSISFGAAFEKKQQKGVQNE